MSTKVFVISDTTPEEPGTAIGSVVAGLIDYDSFVVDAELTGAEGGDLDVYLQREVDEDLWADWIHFPQVSGGSTAVTYTVQISPTANTSIVAVGTGTDSDPGNPALADEGTTDGAPVTIRIKGWKRND
jgi:hypothetical protein